MEEWTPIAIRTLTWLTDAEKECSVYAVLPEDHFDIHKFLGDFEVRALWYTARGFNSVCASGGDEITSLSGQKLDIIEANIFAELHARQSDIVTSAIVRVRVRVISLPQ